MIKTSICFYLDKIRTNSVMDFHGLPYYRCDIIIPKDINGTAYIPKDKVDNGEIEESDYYRTSSAVLTSLYPVERGNHAFRCDTLEKSSEEEQENYGNSVVTLNGRVSFDETFNKLREVAPSGDYIINFAIFINNEYRQTFTIPAFAKFQTAEEISKVANGSFMSVRARLYNDRKKEKSIPNRFCIRVLDFDICKKTEVN